MNRQLKHAACRCPRIYFDGAHRHLGSAAEVPADGALGELLQLDLTGAVIGEGDRRQGIANCVEPLLGPEHSIRLFHASAEASTAWSASSDSARQPLNIEKQVCRAGDRPAIPLSTATASRGDTCEGKAAKPEQNTEPPSTKPGQSPRRGENLPPLPEPAAVK